MGDSEKDDSDLIIEDDDDDDVASQERPRTKITRRYRGAFFSSSPSNTLAKAPDPPFGEACLRYCAATRLYASTRPPSLTTPSSSQLAATCDVCRMVCVVVVVAWVVVEGRGPST